MADICVCTINRISNMCFLYSLYIADFLLLSFFFSYFPVLNLCFSFGLSHVSFLLPSSFILEQPRQFLAEENAPTLRRVIPVQHRVDVVGVKIHLIALVGLVHVLEVMRKRSP